MTFSRIHTRSLLAAASLFLSVTVSAQTAPSASEGLQPSAGQVQMMQQIQQKQAEIQQLNQQLGSIQEATMEANPELAERREELIQLVDSKIEAAGIDAETEREELDALQRKLGADDVSTEQSQQRQAEFQRRGQAYQEAQNQAMQSPEVQTLGAELNADLVAAMQKQNPQTDELISKLQSVQQEYQAMIQQAMQQQQNAG